MITDRRQQIEAQSKGFAPIAFAPIAVTPAQDAEDFEACQSVFHDHALARQLAVVFLLFGRERMMLAFLVRRLTVLVPAVQAPVAGISQTAALFTQPQTAAFEQREVVGVTGTKSRGHNAPTLLPDHNLSFQGVPFLLAAEKVLAFFWALLPLGRIDDTLGRIDNDDLPNHCAGAQSLFARQSEPPGTHQGVLDTAHRARSGRFA